MKTVEEINEMNKIAEHLITGQVGDYVENEDNGRKVEIVDMCGGCYLLFEYGELSGIRDDDGDFVGVTDDVALAYQFLVGESK